MAWLLVVSDQWLVVSVVLSVVAMMILVFILMLLFALVSDVVDFIRVFGKELMLKFF